MPDDWEIIGVNPQEVPEPEENDDWELEDKYDPNLAGIRATFRPELEDPQVKELLAASTIAEVGDQPLHVQRAYMESVFNRASARNSTVADTVLDTDYYPAITHQRMSRKMGNFSDEEMAQLDGMIEDVVKGSNVSRYATGNESLDVHSGGAPVSYNPQTGERFVQENPDLEWVEKTASEPKDWEVVSAGAIPTKEDDWEIIPPAAEKKKPYFATREEEIASGGKGPMHPDVLAEQAAKAEPTPSPPAASDIKPAFEAKQSEKELIDSVESGINAAKEVWEEIQKATALRVDSCRPVWVLGRWSTVTLIHRLFTASARLSITWRRDQIWPRRPSLLTTNSYKHTVQIPAAQRAELGKESAKAGAVGEVAHAVGTMAGDLPQIMLTGGLLPELKAGISLVNTLGHGAAAMTVPAMRAGMDAAEEVKKKGGSDIEQYGAWIRAAGIMATVGSLPMATSSGAATVARRIAERSVKSIPLASAAVESGRMLDNAVSDIFGGEKRPFSLEENIKGTIADGAPWWSRWRARAKSKFERTFGFSPEKFDQRRVDAGADGCGRDRQGNS